MAQNGDLSLGFFSEEGLEALHKLLRRYRETRARKTDLLANITDVFTVLFVRSDPRIRAMRRKIVCSVCQELGHTIRSCPFVQGQEQDSEDELVTSFFV